MNTYLHVQVTNPTGTFVLILAVLITALAGPTSRAAAKAVHIGSTTASSLPRQIVDAYKANARKVIISPGVYRITTEDDQAPFSFRDMSEFEIDGRGVILIFTEPRKGGISLDNCRRLMIRGFTIRFEPLPFTQGLIENIAPDGMWYDLQVDPGYPDLADASEFSSSPFGAIFDARTSWWKSGTVGMAPIRIEPLGLRRYRLHWHEPSGPDTGPVRVGDKMAFRGRLWRHAIAVTGCSEVHLAEITINSSPFAGIVESGGIGGNQYSRITIKRGPRPVTAAADPLISLNADAFHSSGVRNGPTVQNCNFESMLDDGIAIHGSYSLVLGGSGAELIIAINHFLPGDPLRIYDAYDAPVGEARVLSVVRADNFELQQKTSRKTIGDMAHAPAFRLMLDHAVPVGFDYLVANGAALGAGFLLRNNTIRYHRARGILLKSGNGLIENNTITGSTVGGIVITPEFDWAEADYSRNLVVRHNTISNVGYSSYSAGAISVAAWDSDRNRFVPSAGHQNIIIERNTISEVNGPNLVITSAKDVTVRKNRFIKSHFKQPWRLTPAWEMNSDAVIWLAECQNVRFIANTIEQLGPFANVIVHKTATVQTPGIEDGIKLVSRLK